jgi:hypothetical protein
MATYAPDKYTKRLVNKDEPRLVFPFYSDTGKLLGLSGRAFDDEHLRYMTIKADDTDTLIFGLERFDNTKPGYVVEGPIDSFFLPNCIAVGGTAFSKLDLYAEKDKVTIVFDNQPRNPEVCALFRKKIVEDFKVCVWPEYLVEKDINDMILNGATPETVKQMIDEHTFVGDKAMLQFNDWRKC